MTKNKGLLIDVELPYLMYSIWESYKSVQSAVCDVEITVSREQMLAKASYWCLKRTIKRYSYIMWITDCDIGGRVIQNSSESPASGEIEL